MFIAQLVHFLAVHRAQWPPHAHFIYNLFHDPGLRHFPRIYDWAQDHGFVYRP